MAVTVGGTTITFNDGTVQSTAASAVTTTSVLNATAGASLGAVGTYAILHNNNSALDCTVDSVIAGSSLGRVNSNLGSGAFAIAILFSTAGTVGTAQSGSWRCLSYAHRRTTESDGGYGTVNVFRPGLFLRIS